MIVSVGGDATVRLELDPAGVQASVTVSSEAPLIETTKTQVSSVVNEKMIQALPTNGRNFLDVVLSTPGVVKRQLPGRRPRLRRPARDPEQRRRGRRRQQQHFLRPGPRPHGLRPRPVPVQPRLGQGVPGQHQRLLGRVRPARGGAVINVVTKSGTNEFHGNGFYFYRDKSLNAKNYFDAVNGRAKAPYHFDQFGATLGGPIIPDKLFFFANYDGQRNTTPNTVVLSIPANTPTDPDTIAGIAKLTALAGSWNQKQDQDVFLFKADYEHRLRPPRLAPLQPPGLHRPGLRERRRGRSPSSTAATRSSRPTRAGRHALRPSFTPTLFNELRGQYAKDSEPGDGQQREARGDRSNQSGAAVLTIGENFFSPRETTIKRWQIADAATYLFADHTFKGGFDYQHDNILNFFPATSSGPTRSRASARSTAACPTRPASATSRRSRAQPAPVDHQPQPAGYTPASCRTSGAILRT